MPAHIASTRWVRPTTRDPDRGDEDTIVTVDALNCQRAIARQIVDQGGNYAPALKANQATLHDDVSRFLDDPECKASTAPPVIDADHGRIETRIATVCTDIDWLQETHKWPGLAAIGKVVSTRETTVKTTTETPYYLLSAALSAEKFNEVVRSHWGGREPAALASGCRHERRPGSDTHGQRSAQSCGPATYRAERHSEETLQRIAARKTHARRLG